ncbi:unnamed protein product [Enterobius vermicularis]|uniref:Ovule protein n=1 Tax=Enterobius vermicularis TaxID=51028 RepID=A0A0N4VQ52_ENTVE|nr:unnamed protein product [Enterobius vermicularis]
MGNWPLVKCSLLSLFKMMPLNSSSEKEVVTKEVVDSNRAIEFIGAKGFTDPLIAKRSFIYICRHWLQILYGVSTVSYDAAMASCDWTLIL